MSDTNKIMNIFINIDRYDLLIEDGDAAMVPTDSGAWVTFDQVKDIVEQLKQRINYLHGENNQLKGINNQISSISNNMSSVTACPRCGYPQEEDGMRRKECSSCEFVWYSNFGY
jgi:predicted transcriptional regulator